MTFPLYRWWHLDTEGLRKFLRVIWLVRFDPRQSEFRVGKCLLLLSCRVRVASKHIVKFYTSSKPCFFKGSDEVYTYISNSGNHFGNFINLIF